MKKGLSGLGVFLLVMGMVFTKVHAQDTAGPWSVGVRGGAGFLGQDVDQDAEGLTGPSASLTVTRRITNAASLGVANDLANFMFLSTEDEPSALAVGLDVAWTSHKIKSKIDGVNFGVADTVLLLPHVEIRTNRFDGITPYLLLGVGVAFNSFKESPEFAARCTPDPCNIERFHTPAFKIAGGADYFLTPRLALNTELGWKFNDRDVVPKVNATPTLNGLRTNGFTLLTGLRYYF